MKKLIYSAVTLVITAIVLATSFGCSFVKENGKRDNLPSSKAMAQTVEFATGDDESDKLSLEQAVKKVERTSVAIKTEWTEGGQKMASAGSGVIVDIRPDGVVDDDTVYILTCQHMMKENGDITVYLPDEYCAYDNNDYIFTGVIGGGIASNNGKAITLIGGDKESDVALIKLNLRVPAVSGNKLLSSKIVKAQIPHEGYSTVKGETVFAIGNPTGELPGTVTTGVIGYLQRNAEIQDIGTMKLLQISVATNHGSSGGGLYNLYGELIGITNSGNDSYEFVNFAIPMSVYDPSALTDNGFINIASELLGSYTGENYGYISGRKAKFGFTVTENESGGSMVVYVSGVNSGSMAQTAGLKNGDIIKSVSVKRLGDSKFGEAVSISTLDDYKAQVDDLKIGESLQLVVERSTSINPWQYKTVEQTVELTYVQYYFCDTGIYPNV